jgi:hypothetical protein
LEVEVAKATAAAQTTLQTSVDDLPTNAELGARTLPSATYFDPATDQVIVATNNDKTGYALTAAYDAAKTAASQTSVDDLPTNAELAVALGSADDATLAAIAALHNFNPATTEVLADVKKINGTTVNGNGSTTPWGP